MEDYQSSYFEMFQRRDAKLDAATIKATVDFVRNLPATDNLDSVGEIVFK